MWVLNESYGITIYDIISKSSIELAPPSIKDTEHFDIIVDRDNAVWIGTSSYGMMKFDPGKQKFRLFSKNFPSSNPLGFDIGWGATIDKNGDYWTGKAEAYGEIVRIDRKTGMVNRYLQSNDDSRSWFWNFRKVNDGIIVWKGYPGRGENAWYKYKYDTDKFKRITFFALFPDSVASGNWIYNSAGTFAFTGKGIKVYNGSSFILDKELNKNFENDQYLRLSDWSKSNGYFYLLSSQQSTIYKWDVSKQTIKPFF